MSENIALKWSGLQVILGTNISHKIFKKSRLYSNKLVIKNLILFHLVLFNIMYLFNHMLCLRQCCFVYGPTYTHSSYQPCFLFVFNRWNFWIHSEQRKRTLTGGPQLAPSSVSNKAAAQINLDKVAGINNLINLRLCHVMLKVHTVLSKPYSIVTI